MRKRRHFCKPRSVMTQGIRTTSGRDDRITPRLNLRTVLIACTRWLRERGLE